MSKRKKKEHHEEHVDESWLLPYSDLLTLLVALFIVLFAMSSVDAQKFQTLSNVFNKELTGGSGVFEYPSPMPDTTMESTEKDKETEETSEQQAAVQAEQEELQQIQEKVNAYVTENNLTNKFQTSLTEEGLYVSIRDNVLFDSGSAEIREEDRDTVAEIANLLIMDPQRSIIVSGHTDNVPIQNARFSSNWELSVMRAVNFMKLMLENNQLDPQYFSAKGYGEFKPVVSNDTAEGRAQNRRVEILIMPNTSSS